MPNLPINKSPSWIALLAHYAEVKALRMRDLFEQASEAENRFEQFSMTLDLGQESILLDYSKNRITDETMTKLIELARKSKLNQAIKDMFCGEQMNCTEKRAALHVALRAGAEKTLFHHGKDVMQDVSRVLEQMEHFCEKVVSGQWRGFTGKRIKHIINIGIGGSDLGPQMVIHALKPYWNKALTPHFVANIDASDLHDTLEEIDFETSLFVVASKSFTSKETMANASAAKTWFIEKAGGDEAVIAQHFVAISSNASAVKTFGIASDNMFEFWDWVGGRYSLWSAIGLPIALMVGMRNFRQLLLGAHIMDNHFRDAPFEENMPIIMAVLGVWYRDFFNASSYAILPYDHYLRKLPAYLQQSDMESNGKRVTRGGEEIDYQTGPVVWGAAGANGQHAFYQLIHQGTQLVPADFIVPVQSHSHAESQYGEHHKLLLSNCIAQTEALMRGRSHNNVVKDNKNDPRLIPHRTFPGNRPSNTIVLDKITPQSLGALIALYEHKIFAQGIIWDINSFDQMGVELGKHLSQAIEPELNGEAATREHDCSTASLIKYVVDRQQ